MHVIPVARVRTSACNTCDALDFNVLIKLLFVCHGWIVRVLSQNVANVLGQRKSVY